MSERNGNDWNQRQRAALARVREAEEGGYPPAAIDVAKANGHFDLTADGREGVYLGSMPPVPRSMARRGISGPQLPEA